jgi:lipid II:glycine glycyltransferase (peptidoglycan interpeptide bridge formation enzyme)
MERNEALEPYYFDRGYFQAIFEEMPAGARFALAEHEGRVIAATLYLHDADDVYSYLGGADHDHQHLRPTNAVVHDTIRWAREHGKRRLVLGGGYRPDDGIFRFKASFSPQRATLELVRRVHLPDDLERLTAAWHEHHGPGAEPGEYFPAYRSAG